MLNLQNLESNSGEEKVGGANSFANKSVVKYFNFEKLAKNMK